MVIEMYNPYEKYGIRRVINAASSLTRLGGSISPSEVFRAMEDASKSFVQIPELQQWAGRAIAEATGAEAGLPTAGSSNAIVLAAAACIMKGTELEKYDPLELETWTHLIKRLPMHTEGLKTEFIVQRSNRNVYDHAVECAGGRFVEVGTVEGTTQEELSEAFDPRKTAAYYFTDRTSDKRLPLATVIKIAHEHDAPVIVDAASELPPKKNLRKYISKGADLVIISGGKFIAGPNNSGILAGRRDLIKLAHLQAYPFHGVGRPSKMSRETIVGLVTALKIYLELDEDALFAAWENKVRWIVEQMNSIPNVEAGLTYERTVEEKEPMVPLCYVEIDEEAFGKTEVDLRKKLREGNPSIETRIYAGRLTINPEFILEGDESTVIQRIGEILTQAMEG
jgi:D-glucosaminate-6-phosphate ammonia-lyase